MSSPALNLQNVVFIKSAAEETDFIQDSRPSVIFAGRSNAGKSSVINCLLNRRQFAHVGATPGKTIHVNYFLIDNRVYWIDLPGYGFAKVSDAEKRRWKRLMNAFFDMEAIGRRGVLVTDIRREPAEDDLLMASYMKQAGIPYVIAANKADKLKKNVLNETSERINQAFAACGPEFVAAVSARTGEGKDKLIDFVCSAEKENKL